MFLGVHGVPFSSVRSTKPSANLKNLNENESHAYPGNMSHGLTKYQSALIHDESHTANLSNRKKTK